MENSNVYIGQMPKQQLMRLHRLLAIFAVILFGLMEAIVVTTVFGQKRAAGFPVAFLLPTRRGTISCCVFILSYDEQICGALKRHPM